MSREQREVLQTVALIIMMFIVMIGAAMAADRLESLPRPRPNLSFDLKVDIQEQPEREYDLLTYHISVTNRGARSVNGLHFWGHLPQQTLELLADERPWLGTLEPTTIQPAGQEGATRQWTVSFAVQKISTLLPPQLKTLQDPRRIMLLVEAEGLSPTQYYFN